MRKPLHLVLVVLCASGVAGDVCAQWTPLNMVTNISVNALAVQGDDLYAGTDNGVFRTSNNGISWESISDGLVWGYGYVPTVQSLAIFGDTLLAGTDGYYAYRSTNGGSSWKGCSTGLGGKSMYAITVSDGEIFAGTDKGVYRSTNAGSNWSKSGTGLPSMHSTIVDIKVVGGVFFAASQYGVYVSLNRGVTWGRSNAGMADTNVVALATDGRRVYAVTTRKSVYISVNSGYSWVNVSNGLPIDTVRPNTVSLSVSKDTVFVGTSDGVFRSTNMGVRWEPARGGLPPTLGIYAGYKSMAVVNGWLFAGTSGNKEFASSEVSLGIYCSSNHGFTWEARNAGLSNHYFHTYPAATGGSCVFLGTNTSTFDTHQSFYRSTDNGEHWTSSVIDEIDTRGLIRLHDTLFAGTVTFSKDKSGVMISTDSGATWHGITDSGSRVMLSAGFQKKAGISVLAANNGTMYCATLNGVVYRSYNSGVTWELASTNLPGAVVAITFIRNDVLVATNVGVYRTSNDGTTWFADTLGLGAQNITALKVIGNDLYAGIGSVPYVSFGNGVFVLRNGATSWKSTNKGLPSWTSARSFTNANGTIFVATDYGVYKSINAGNEWIAAGEGFSNYSIDWISATDDFVFAAASTGVYRRPMTELLQGVSGVGDREEVVEDMSLRNYPDPVSVSAVVEFTLTHPAQVSLKMYDRMGDVVRVLAQGRHERGVYSIPLSMDELKSGIYWYVLATEGKSIVRSTRILR